MQFLVTGHNVDVGPLLPPEQLVMVIEQAIVPTFEVFAQWEQAGTIRGGLFAGERAGAFILEAASAEEVGQMIGSLPAAGLVKWEVKALQSFRSSIEQTRQVAAQSKAMSGH